MADVNSWTLPVASWLDPREWAAAPRPIRDRFLARAAELAKAAKQSQVRRGIGADGEPLIPRQKPRADGADGKPLDPHYGESRSFKWVRASVGSAKGTVTVWWSHGWGKILGYHARGEVIGAYLRNIIGFPPGILARLKADVRHFWRGLIGGAGHTAPKSPPKPPAMPARPRPAFPAPRPAAARPAAMLLRPGRRP